MRDFALYYAEQEHNFYPIGAGLIPIVFKFFKYRGYQREIDPPRDLSTCYIHQIIVLRERVLEVQPSSNRTADLRDRIARLFSEFILITENDQSNVIEGVFKVLDDPVPDLPVVVYVAEVTMQIVDDIATESLATLSHRLIPATRSSIESLEKVGRESLELNSIIEQIPSCAICMEDLDYSAEEEGVVVDPDLKRRRGIVITRMPCLHCYHEVCIVRWLEINHLCPICRYPMPTVGAGAGH